MDINSKLKYKEGPLIEVKTVQLTKNHLICKPCNFQAKSKSGLSNHKNGDKHKENVKLAKERKKVIIKYF